MSLTVVKRLCIWREIAQLGQSTPCACAQRRAWDWSWSHSSTHLKEFYFRHKRAEQRAPRITVLSKYALMFYGDDDREFAISFSRFHCCGRHGIGPIYLLWYSYYYSFTFNELKLYKHEFYFIGNLKLTFINFSVMNEQYLFRSAVARADPPHMR